MKKHILVEYLYLDLNTCDRCIGTDKILDEVMATLTPAFELAGYIVLYKKREITTAQMAEQYHFLSSPTIRVNKKDICDSIMESDCGCCGNISGTQVDCRIFEYEGETYEIPPKAMLAELILKAAFAPKSSCCCDENYSLPENLQHFFEGKKMQEKQASCDCSCSCSCDCC